MSPKRYLHSRVWIVVTVVNRTKPPVPPLSFSLMLAVKLPLTLSFSSPLSMTCDTPASLEDMDPYQEEDLLLTHGPLKLLHKVKNQRIKVLVQITNKKNVFGYVVGYKKCWNLLRTNVLEISMEERKGKVFHREIYLRKLLLRGENIASLVKDPLWKRLLKRGGTGGPPGKPRMRPF